VVGAWKRTSLVYEVESLEASAKIADDTEGTSFDSAHARLVERAISWLMTHPSQLSFQDSNPGSRKNNTESSKGTHELLLRIELSKILSSKSFLVVCFLCGFSLLVFFAIGDSVDRGGRERCK
jgi:hypothetical protein